ncbi:hypothetical protein BC936DRAFT_139983, partial [Jimgerdemannia flammicorona]
LLKELGSLFERYTFTRIDDVWVAVEDLLAANNVEARHEAFNFMTACIEGQYGELGMARVVFYNAVRNHAIWDDFVPMFTVLFKLTKEGRDISLFEKNIVKLLASWLDSALRHAEILRAAPSSTTAIKRHSTSNVPTPRPLSLSQSAINPVTAPVPHLQPILNLITLVVKFNPANFEQRESTDLVHAIHRAFGSTRNPDDARFCINFLDVLVRFGSCPPPTLSDITDILCRTINWDAVAPPGDHTPPGQAHPWAVFQNLLRSHYAQNAVRIMCERLRKPASLDRSAEEEAAVRGALTLLGRAVWETRVNLSMVMTNVVLLVSMRAAVARRWAVVDEEMLRWMNVLVDQKEGEISSMEWDVLLDIAEDLARYVLGTDRRRKEAAAITRDNSTGAIAADDDRDEYEAEDDELMILDTRDNGAIGEVVAGSNNVGNSNNEQFLCIVASYSKFIFNLQYLHMSSSYEGSVPRYMALLHTLRRHLSGTSTIVLLDYYEREHLLYPSSEDWLTTLAEVTDTFYCRHRRSPRKTRLRVLQIVADIYMATKDFYSDDVLDRIVIPMVRGLARETEPEVTQQATDLVVQVMQECEERQFGCIQLVIQPPLSDVHTIHIHQRRNGTVNEQEGGGRPGSGDTPKPGGGQALSDKNLVASVNQQQQQQQQRGGTPISRKESMRDILSEAKKGAGAGGGAPGGSGEARPVDQAAEKAMSPELRRSPFVISPRERKDPHESPRMWPGLQTQVPVADERMVELPIGLYLVAVVELLKNEREWDVFSYVLHQLSVQLACKHLFCGTTKELRLLRELLCDQILDNKENKFAESVKNPLRIEQADWSGIPAMLMMHYTGGEAGEVIESGEGEGEDSCPGAGVGIDIRGGTDEQDRSYSAPSSRRRSQDDDAQMEPRRSDSATALPIMSPQLGTTGYSDSWGPTSPFLAFARNPVLSPARIRGRENAPEDTPPLDGEIPIGSRTPRVVDTMVKEIFSEPVTPSENMVATRRGDSSTDPSFLFLQLGNYPDLNNPLSAPLPDNETTTRSIAVLDRMAVVDFHKIAVLYVGRDQTKEVDILSNQHGSPDYITFLNSLGTITRLRGNKDIYTGGLDTESDIDGEYAYYWKDAITQLIFHVATMMPFNERDPQRSLKKRHLGNDFVTIVYNDSGRDYMVSFATLPHFIRQMAMHANIFAQIFLQFGTEFGSGGKQEALGVTPTTGATGPLAGSQEVPAAKASRDGIMTVESVLDFTKYT